MTVLVRQRMLGDGDDISFVRILRSESRYYVQVTCGRRVDREELALRCRDAIMRFRGWGGKSPINGKL